MSAGQPGFFDSDERSAALSAAGDPLERLGRVMTPQNIPQSLLAILIWRVRALEPLRIGRAALAPTS